MALAWCGCVNVAVLRRLLGCRPRRVLLWHGRRAWIALVVVLTVKRRSRSGRCDAIETVCHLFLLIAERISEENRCL